LYECLQKTQTWVELSLHDERQRPELVKIITDFLVNPVAEPLEFGTRYQDVNGITVVMYPQTDFSTATITKNSRGFGIHNSDPKKAHAICGAPNTPVLYKGKLYKCPAVANAMDLSGENWFDYTPCDSDVGLDEFINNIGRPEAVCGQCPQLNQAVIIDHFDTNNVIVKQKISS
jgi:hypothetical protein